MQASANPSAFAEICHRSFVLTPRLVSRDWRERFRVKKTNNHSQRGVSTLRKSPTGIRGLDEVTGGGLPTGRPTILSGGPGCGKTMMAMQFLVRGAQLYGEPGVFVAFEETPRELIENFSSFNFNLESLIAKKKLLLDYIYIERSEMQETGEYDLEGLFIRLQHAIESVRAKRVVIDTLEALFSGFQNVAILRAEIRRLFRFLKEKGVTTIITAERGETNLSRYGLEEYVSDCVVVLDHRVNDQISTRRLRVVKYRGTLHGTNEYPFLIEDHGISVLPITSLGLQHTAPTKRMSSGISDLDDMLEGKGYYRGSTILVSGTAGSGKTSIAAHFANEVAGRGEKCLYVAFEESVSQITRNMKSIGLDLEPSVKKDVLTFHAARPTEYGLEMHLLEIHRLIEEINPKVVIVDPITDLLYGGSDIEIRSMLMRLIDHLKMKQTTALFTSLNSIGSSIEQTEVGVSSLIDTWIVLREVEITGERNRGVFVLKSRGMAHSNQIRELLLTKKGIRILPAAQGLLGVLAGSARFDKDQQEMARVDGDPQPRVIAGRDLPRTGRIAIRG